ncbi:hypothetical protein [Pseudoduganella albidiflava]|uniref:HEAT repeat domain-containing protein n=1 Tax=Pseudoduganella albidiflava TaxID=321983 RepID=A0A411WX24_9BURK|nr:hypothetical protein [Pseudoduganella albidiflava]QBI01178.1 hypothetical protein EYF70_10230 [Pseudoduganella albidiflava]GGY48716.1 hypothetical protein GCM10007387_33700 [Pseudoduganella albidiflava]
MAVLNKAMAAAMLAMSAIASSSAALPEQETLERLARMRAMPAAAAGQEAQRQRRDLDAAWRWFGNHKTTALPVLRRELAAELKKPKPSQLVLLDVGYFLRALGEPADRALSMQALLAIDPAGIVPKTQAEQLFRFIHASAADRDPRLFPLIDKVFLRGDVTVLVPQHGYTVDATSVCIYLYGQFGTRAEQHLRGLLNDPAVVNRVLEVLMWVGSPDSVPAVARLLDSTDADTFARAATFMLRAGGPQGRDALLAFDPRRLEGKARQFYLQTRPQLSGMHFDALVQQLSDSPPSEKAAPPRRLDEAAARQLLAALFASHGSYEGIQPIELALAAMPSAQLIDELLRLRERSLLRISGEALADIDTTNTLINTLRFRPN